MPLVFASRTEPPQYTLIAHTTPHTYETQRAPPSPHTQSSRASSLPHTAHRTLSSHKQNPFSPPHALTEPLQPLPPTQSTPSRTHVYEHFKGNITASPRRFGRAGAYACVSHPELSLHVSEDQSPNSSPSLQQSLSAPRPSITSRLAAQQPRQHSLALYDAVSLHISLLQPALQRLATHGHSGQPRGRWRQRDSAGKRR